ncbi:MULTISPECIES: LLM class flavin-dependent oxidoreductase [unclassified Beijerinckia]|uniref:LLM class flavin-dependent oxidoreductase n=1 Tax=unclassified Beijerinckia TaxID=2638183 RepID=UPI000898BD0A|nr:MULTISPECIES: LLM class flavin-dependent oxidoreductase [unclassified Beijerinckia]MDH7797855.1 alkanesulfonate monooxygenase SsuD/methylene tetrahydromethanopterin reductase-like flavin-dependent oxidoreductase (luciferase family) [Beijerinckia sp. GAS462]SED00781.1 Flavin-dependent oxidoreductase, luciferase family (includes alkanesulfonate monooxygenase SsuD and methylene tetrahydromethanopterin reductase) [Beijerinckia sp. 28-YEA-48]
MYAWHFTEMPYPHLPPIETLSTMRVSLASQHFDPRLGADLYNRYFDEYLIADDLGLNLLLNEHHQTATCIDVAAPLSAAILARQTRKGRICILGNPIANRGDPLRIAEEMAMIDCISRGRLDVGFVRGVPYEIFAANTNPTQTVERLWEGIDLVTKAWTTTDGPFNFEGRFTHRRAINLWPRPYQTPHPAIWLTGSSDLDNIKRAAARGFVFATFLQPHAKVKWMFDGYRSAFRDTGLPGGGGTAYMPLVFTADSDAEAEAGARELTWYLDAKSEPQYRNPPGYVTVDFNVQALKGAFSGRSEAMRKQSIEFLKDQGVLIYGKPDDVAQQIKRLYNLVGGFDHLLMMQQAGYMSHERTVKSMTLFAKEVYPQILDLPRTKPLSVAAAE